MASGSRLLSRAARPAARATRGATGVFTGVALCALAACSGSSGVAGSSPTPSAPLTSSSKGTPKPTAAPAAYAPLLGSQGATPATAARPLLAIAMVAPQGAAAPLGLDKADVVYDELGDSGSARLLALFHSRDSAAVGPVDDTRPDDSRVLAVTGGLLAHGGGTRGIVVQLDRSVVADLGRPAHPGAYTARSGYPAGFNLFTSTTALYALAPSGRKAPPSLFAYGGPGHPAPHGTPRTRITVTVPGHPSETWEYGAAARTWKMTAGPVPGLTVANLVVQSVTYKPARVDKRHTIDVAVVVGDGRVTVAAGRLVGTGTWRKPAPKKLTTFLDDVNIPFRLEPGQTWVILAPAGSAVSAR